MELVKFINSNKIEKYTGQTINIGGVLYIKNGTQLKPAIQEGYKTLVNGVKPKEKATAFYIEKDTVIFEKWVVDKIVTATANTIKTEKIISKPIAVKEEDYCVKENLSNKEEVKQSEDVKETTDKEKEQSEEMKDE